MDRAVERPSEVFGPQIDQKGSLVTEDRLRFDFSYKKPIELDELKRIEDIVAGSARAHTYYWVNRYSSLEILVVPLLAVPVLTIPARMNSNCVRESVPAQTLACPGQPADRAEARREHAGVRDRRGAQDRRPPRGLGAFSQRT